MTGSLGRGTVFQVGMLRLCAWISALILLTFVSATKIQSEWDWTWTCVGDVCVKSSTPDRTSSVPNGTGTTLDICRLICGSHGSLWPLPTGDIILGKRTVFFHPSKMKFDYSGVEGDEHTKGYLQKMSKIFVDRMFAACGTHCNFVPETEVNVHFKVKFADLKLNWDTDETYSLEVSTKEPVVSVLSNNVTSVHIKIRSKTVYGSRHALETVLQLVTSNVPQNLKKSRKRFLVMISSVKITDAPAFPHRGLLLDTARHYFSVEAILRTLDAMATTKLNVFHWHVTDTQSFPLETPRVPQMLRYGAYSQDQIYTTEDTRSIIEYARLRGIRVIIEVDAPAHAGNGWQWGETYNLGKLALCVNKQPWHKFCIQPPCGQLNPVNPNVYGVLKDIFADIMEMLPKGETFHVGGDEVFFPCWNASADIIRWMRNNGIKRTEDGFLYLWGMYQENVLNIFSEINPTANVPVILWSSRLTEPDVIEKYLDKDRYIIESWLPANSLIPEQLLAKGYKLIMATKDKWYLDHGFWGTTIYHSWKVAYNNKLPRHPNVLGGEAAIWSERVDEYSIDVKVWPRAAAVAERLWTNPILNADSAESRFEYFRERLIRNEIRADAISPYYCYQNENECS